MHVPLCLLSIALWFYYTLPLILVSKKVEVTSIYAAYDVALYVMKYNNFKLPLKSSPFLHLLSQSSSSWNAVLRQFWVGCILYQGTPSGKILGIVVYLKVMVMRSRKTAKKREKYQFIIAAPTNVWLFFIRLRCASLRPRVLPFSKCVT